MSVMMYLFVYESNGQPLPPEKMAENQQAWQAWNAALKEVYGIKTTTGGKVVSAEGVEDYTGNLRGVSIVEADSLEAAVEKAKQSPAVMFGGTVTVLAEFQRQ